MRKELLQLATAKAKLAAVAIGALALGGVAATTGSTSFLPVDNSSDVTVSPSPTETADPADTAKPAEGADDANEAGDSTAPTPTDTATPAVTPAPCPTDVKNHGAYVSSVAKDHSTTGRAHGQAVSAAAQSDCGKTADGTDQPEAADPAETESPDPAETESGNDQGDQGQSHHAKKAHTKHGTHHQG